MSQNEVTERMVFVCAEGSKRKRKRVFFSSQWKDNPRLDIQCV